MIFIALAELREDMTRQDPSRLGLLRTAENLIGQISGPNAGKVHEKVEEVREKWEGLVTAVQERSAGQ